MFELITKYPKIFAVVLSSCLVAIGYFYKDRLDKKKNLKTALYILLEVWHRMSIFYRRDFDDVFEKLFIKIKNKFPNENISDSEIETTKEHFSPILQKHLRNKAFSNIDDFQEKYTDAVLLIASQDPILAYQISSVSSGKQFFDYLEGYLEESLAEFEKQDENLKLSAAIKSKLSEHAEIDVLKDLERDIKKVAFRISLFTYISVIISLNKRKSLIKSPEKLGVEQLVDNLLIPIINEFKKSLNKD